MGDRKDPSMPIALTRRYVDIDRAQVVDSCGECWSVVKAVVRGGASVRVRVESTRRMLGIFLKDQREESVWI